MNQEQYLDKYAAALGALAEKSLRPLHIPGIDPVVDGIGELKRKPFPAQAHCITGLVEILDDSGVAIFVGEQGVGKTLVSEAAVHLHAAGKPYRALVMAPGHITRKWKREIESTLKGVRVHLIEKWGQLIPFKDKKPTCGEWLVIGRDRAKLGPRWKVAVNHYKHLGKFVCTTCGQQPVDKEGNTISLDTLEKRKSSCGCVNADGKVCGGPLWTFYPKPRKWSPAKFIKEHLGILDYYIADECHELKGADTANGGAMGEIASASKHTLALTGTITGGSADHLRAILWRILPSKVKRQGFRWNQTIEFSEKYGRLETRVTEKEYFGSDNRMSKGKKSSSVKCVPGIMPAMFGDLLIGNTVFLSLEEVAEGLPDCPEEVVGVDMDPELHSAYKDVEDVLRDTIKELIPRGNKSLLGPMVHCLLAYPDHPYDWKTICYRETGDGGARNLIPVVTPPTLDSSRVWAKERKLIEMCQEAKSEGRKVWVYVQYTDTHPVAGRLKEILATHGLRVDVLRAKVEPTKREEWIAKNAPGLDVIISHPKLVETGIDFFDKEKTYNIPEIIFYEVGYKPNETRQASRRAWRIGQSEDCRIRYLYYNGTMGDAAVALMGKKIAAAQGLEGRFSSEGLAGLDDSIEMALARSLANHIQDSASRAWGKVQQFVKKTPPRNKLAHSDLVLPPMGGVPAKPTQLKLYVEDEELELEPVSAVQWNVETTIMKRVNGRYQAVKVKGGVKVL